jgi:hypothetical protein
MVFLPRSSLRSQVPQKSKSPFATFIHRMSTPRRPDAGVPQRPAPDAHHSLLKLPPPQIIFCAANPAPGLRPLVWVNAP